MEATEDLYGKDIKNQETFNEVRTFSDGRGDLSSLEIAAKQKASGDRSQ